jgi:hypothetical protein
VSQDGDASLTQGQEYVNVTGFEVPLDVVMTTSAEDEPEIVGAVIVHVFCAGQLVGAT